MIRYVTFARTCFLVIAMGLSLPSLLTGQRSRILTAREIAQYALPSTVTVIGKTASGVVTGSGFFVKSNVIATSYHVIEGTSEAVITLYGQTNPFRVTAVVASSKQDDLVLLRVIGVHGKPLRLNQNDAAGIGDRVFVVGNPEGLEGTFSEGIVSSIRKLDTTKLLQITAAISHGSSGGAVLNQRGEVIGVARGTLQDGQSLNFAVPVSSLRQLMNSQSSSVAGPFDYLQYVASGSSLGFSFQVHPTIQQSIDFYRNAGRSQMETGLYRSGMFMRMARRIFREEGVPENIAWIGQTISGWQPAGSLWFKGIDISISSKFGLQNTEYVDERNSFDEATRASARYLKYLANRYHGNWELAIAAYSIGENDIDLAIRKARVENFWLSSRYIPKAARDFVPNCLATILIANNPNQYGFGHIRPAAPLVYERIRIPASTNLSVIAQAADTSVQYLRWLNPHLRTDITPPEPYVINVPAGKADEVVAVFRRIPASRIDSVNLADSSAGETWENISNRTGVSVADLMAANPGMATPQGKVVVPVSGNNVNAIIYSRPSNISVVGESLVVHAEAGDTVQQVAERYNANATEVAKYNGLLPNSVLGAGREIKIPLTAAPLEEVLLSAEKEFREGLIAYRDRKLSDAGEKFNKSVEVFLYSTLNIQRNPKLQACYNKLIETIYRIEFPKKEENPQIKILASTCGWTNLDDALIDAVTTQITKP